MIQHLARIFTVAFGIIYWPINALYIWVQKWYFKIEHEDIVLYWLFAPFYWILFIIVTVFSTIYEKIGALAGH